MEAKLTPEQWQELYEWAGFYHGDDCLWHDPNGAWVNQLPPQDMNTLWLWMVPKLGGMRLDYYQAGHYEARVLFAKPHMSIHSNAEHIDPDPFEAIAGAIYKVVKDVQTR